MSKILRFFFYLLVLVKYIESARILGLFVIPSISHQVTFQAIWKELSLRGHNVTIMSPNILNDKSLTNLTEIDVNFTYDIIQRCNLTQNMSKDRYLFNIILFLSNFIEEVTIAEILHKDIQKLIHDKKQHFDVILVENLHPLIYAFGARFKAPIIGVSSSGSFLQTYDALGNPTHPVISPDIIMNFEGKLTFFDSVKSFLFNIWYRALYYWYILPRADGIARKHFGNEMPYLGDIEKNLSLHLINVNPVVQTIRPNVPAIIEIGELHIRKNKPIPKNIKTILDAAKQGVIYFSLGSNVKSSTLPIKIRTLIIDALSELPYQILWKWETDHLPGQPKNVLVSKWFPQQDILGHPNVKAFLTQGGLQSIEESIMNEVPMIAMPFFGDQPLNVIKLVDIGVAIGLDYNTMTKDQLKNAIIDVAENNKYKNEVKKWKSILLDQPMKGLEKAVWWIEYVIRHKGAAHLRSPAADMPLVKYLMLDVIAVLVLLLVLSMYLLNKTYFFIKSGKTKVKIN